MTFHKHLAWFYGGVLWIIRWAQEQALIELNYIFFLLGVRDETALFYFFLRFDRIFGEGFS